MDSMQAVLDKLFIGYDPNDSIDEGDGGSPKSMIAITTAGAMEAYADLQYLGTGKPLHWEACYELPPHDGVVALLEVRRLARSLGLSAMHDVRRPVVQEAIMVVSGKRGEESRGA